MSWQKTIRLAQRTGLIYHARVRYDEDDGCPFLEIGVEESDLKTPWRSYPLTWNTAGDLAHALQELIEHRNGGLT